MRFIAFAACFLLAVPAAAQQQHQLDTLSPAQAISRAAALPNAVRATVEFKVDSAAKSRGGYYFDKGFALDVEPRRDDPSALSELTKKFGDHLKAALVGKTVKIIGPSSPQGCC